MPSLFTRSLLAVLLTSSFAAAQEAHDNTLQALLKEVRALRIALERSNQISPKMQIALARMQFQEERVREANRELHTVRERLSDVQNKLAEMAEQIKQTETQQAQTTDPNVRKDLDHVIIAAKMEVGQLGTQEQQIRAREAEANALVLSEQAKWNEVNDLLVSMERMLTSPEK